MNRNILSRFTIHTKQALERASSIALNEEAIKVTNVHLLYGIAFEKGSAGQNILRELGFEKNSLFNLRLDLKTTKTIPFSQALQGTIKKAARIASNFHYPYIGTEHLTHAILESPSKKIRELLDKSSNKRKNLLNKKTLASYNFGKMPDFSQIMGIHLNSPLEENKSGSSLLKYAVNLNSENEKREAHPIIGKEDEIEKIINIILRKNKNNPVLIGEPGVGKTAIVAGLAQRINRGEVPVQMANKIIYELDLGLLLSGTTFRGEFEQRMKEVIEQAIANDEVILFIDEIHNLIGAGSAQGSLDAANMLKPALAKGKLKLIGATTLDEYRRHIEKDAALERRFQPIVINEPQEKETRKILLGIQKSYEEHHGVKIDKKVIEGAISLSIRYINDRFLPDKAIDLIDEAQAYIKANAISSDISKQMKDYLNQKKRIGELKKKLILSDNFKMAANLKKEEEKIDELLKTVKKEQARREKLAYLRVTENDIKKIIADHTNIPLKELACEDKLLANSLEKKLNKEIVGQKEAVMAITKTIQRSISGINDPDRPLGSFIFLGPTGVGKTYLAKVLAEKLFKNPASFLRIDMSEFSQKHQVSQLIGAPAGYVGYEDGAKLTDKIRRNPYSLILLDEIEKAHPEIFNILLQILEDGSLTDSTGRKVNFKNTIIVMTSNIGAEDFLKGNFGFIKNTGKNKVSLKNKSKFIEGLQDLMLPELINRIDKLVIFNSLSLKNLEKIAQKEIEKLNRRLKKNRVILQLGDDSYQYLAKKSFNLREGTRLLRKNMEKYIQDPLADILINKEIKKDTAVVSKVKKGHLILEVKK